MGQNSSKTLPRLSDGSDHTYHSATKREKNKIQEKNSIDNSSSLKSLEEAKTTVPTVFRWQHTASHVMVSGTFNNWSENIELVRSGDEFMIIINLPIGTYQYKYLVDNIWRVDTSIETILDSVGNTNNVLHINETDLNIFDALDNDLISQKKDTSLLMYNTNFDRVIPYQTYYQNAMRHLKAGQASLIETLPRNSLNSVLNESINSDFEQSSFNHGLPDNSCLNHLFALGIKDNVLATSVTQRFRKKYVTTVYFRPST